VLKTILYDVMFYLVFVLALAVLVMAGYAAVHAGLQRPDAYTAVGKLTKPVWLLILVAAVGLAVLGVLYHSITGIAIAACASGVYLADVRPKLLEIQGKSR
jgi:uncharacterized membrane protein YozB (DUF420 family)